MEDKARGYGGQDIVLPDDTRRAIAELVNGDARRALNTLEMMADMAELDDAGKRVLQPQLLTEIAGERSARFDNKGDRFYDLISALHKSVRGSAPDAALYWYARIISAGGDPLYVARRCLAIASEDVGNADPRAMQVAISAWDCFTRVGPAEGERAIAQAIVYLACAPKSNAVYTAFKAAMADARERPDYDVPVHLRNAPTKLMKEMGYGQEYRYAHDEPNAYAAGEEYFPSEMAQTRYYHPTNRGLEGKIGEKLAWLAEQDQNSRTKRYR
ncbi:Holliday junction DNA helicase [Kluyvera ascorbata ATCC 33433]|nr:Holliday junction DNA helicase [Kluyvera ascorbata ATCC 33433]